jgi:ATP-binding cassette subfamily C protein CydCD
VKPLDPRLLRYARSTRGFVIITVLLGVVMAILVIISARLLSTAIVEVAQGRGDLATSIPVLLGLLGIIGARAVIAWVSEAIAYRTSARAKAQLREAALEHILRLGPTGPASNDPGRVATLLTRGIDALDAYYARYLPQLFLAMIVPIAIIATVIGFDLISALIIAITLPIIVVFMILIGLYTRTRVDRQWKTLSRLSGHFLDLIAGLPTLKVLGRAQKQAQAIGEIGDRYRSTTMGVLRVSFLSSFALELLASLSVALVAVTIGVRLVEGGITFSVALFILILAPEAYLPLRMVGQHFHAAAEGLGAADDVFTMLEQPVPATGDRTDIPSRPSVIIDGLTVTYPGRESPALHPTTLTIAPGEVIAVVGASGGGKSTLLRVLLGFITPTGGRVMVEGAMPAGVGRAVDLTELDPDHWRTRIGWVPQEPHLIAPATQGATTVTDAVRLGRLDASVDDVRAALRAAGVLDEIESLPEGIRTPIGEGGAGLSAGQIRRVALARALVRPVDLLLLDEPTAALDGASEAAVITALRNAAQSGVAVVVVAHRPALLDIADVVVHVGAPQLPERLSPTERELLAAEAQSDRATRGTLTGGGW